MSTISFRADDATEEALRDLMSDEKDRSAAIREAILTAWQVRQDEKLRAEATLLAADEKDRAEIRAVQEDLESLRAW